MNKYFIPIFIALSALISIGPAEADYFVTIVKYDCDIKKNRVRVTYLGGANRKGDALLKSKGENGWEPWELIEMKDDDNIGGLKMVQKMCSLSSGPYDVTIGPRPGNMNIQRQCGAAITAWVEIKHSGNSLGRYEFEDFDKACNFQEPERVITEVRVDGDRPNHVTVTTVPASRFGK